MSEHTPGPWKITTSWKDYMVEGPNGEEIIWQDGPYGTPTISEADARLIAAAPDLLKFAQAMARYASRSGEDYLEEQARAVIDKATKGTP